MAQRICEVVMDTGERCERPAVARGMCYLHLSRLRSGTSMGAPISPHAKPLRQCEYCDRLAEYSTTCAAHYQQVRQGLTPRRVFRRGTTDEEKVTALLAAGRGDGGCLIADRVGSDGCATSVKDSQGRFIKTHRLVYRVKNGPIPPGEQIHHTCANRACIEPTHLVRATQRENVGEMLGRLAYERRIAALEAEVLYLREQLDLKENP